jgi:toxin ParE1/3/4
LAKVAFSRRAGVDLQGIGEYTQQTWGVRKASLYLADLEQCCQLLAENPLLGRSCDEIRPGLRRMEHGSHVVLYRLHTNRRTSGILVSRILHRSMLPERHPAEGDPQA